MRSGLLRLASSSSAVVLTALVALASVAPAHAQPKPAAKPAAAQPAKPAAKPAAAPAKPPPPKDPKATPTKLDKSACATEPKKNLADAKKKDEAKKAYKDGEGKFDKTDFEGALPCYKLADAYIPGAAPKFKIAASLDKLGRVGDAVAAYDAFLATNPPEDKYKDKIAEAKTRSEILKKTPSKVKVATTPAMLPNPKLMLDGVAQSSMELMVPPGKHTLMITADGYDASTQPIEVGYAETRDVSLTLNKSLEPVAVAPTATATATATVVAVVTAAPTQAPVTPPVEKRSNVPAYVTLGLAGAGAIVGGIFGGMALASKSDFDKTPTVDKADETDRNALIADMSFAVALTFGVTGAVLLLSDSSPSAPAKTGLAGPQKSQKKSALRGFIAPYATPTGGGAAARFSF